MAEVAVYHVQRELLRKGRLSEQPDVRYDAAEVVLLADYAALLRSSTDQTILFGLAVKHLDKDAHARFLAEPKAKELLDRIEDRLPPQSVRERRKGEGPPEISAPTPKGKGSAGLQSESSCSLDAVGCLPSYEVCQSKGSCRHPRGGTVDESA